MIKVILPTLNVNDEMALLTKWFKKENEKVEKGEVICSFETSKSNNDVEAEQEGFIVNRKFKEGDQVPFNQAICYIIDNLEEHVKNWENVSQENKREEKQTNFNAGIKATKKAIKLAKSLNIDLKHLKISSVIREKDVFAFHNRTSSIGSSTEKPVITSAEKKQNIKADFFQTIRLDPAFKSLSSELKLLRYKEAGASFGKNVKLGFGSLILAKHIVIEDDVSIGENTYIECDELYLGKAVRIGDQNDFVSGKISIGDATHIANKVIVDLSGGKTKRSLLVVGSQCLIAVECYLNTSREIIIGNNVALSPRAMIYTHSFWQSVLEGFSANFNKVEIKNNAWLGSVAQLLPGVTVGEYSIVMSGSVVVNNVEPSTMVGGVPAIIQKKGIRKKLSPNAKNQVLLNLLKEFSDFIHVKGYFVTFQAFQDYAECVIDLKNDKHKKIILIFNKDSIDLTDSSAIYLGLSFKENLDHLTLFDVAAGKITGPEGRLSNELRNFLRRRGILFSPIHWHYSFEEGL